MIYCTICKDYYKEEHDDLWDCIVIYEKKEKFDYESAFSKLNKNLK